MKRFVSAGRVLDLLAILAVLFVAYKILIAPRFLSQASAYPAPRVSFTALSGRPFVLGEHRGRVVFLDFYASWCEPCKASLPMVEKFARTHSDVDVIPVDVGEPRRYRTGVCPLVSFDERCARSKSALARVFPDRRLSDHGRYRPEGAYSCNVVRL